MRCIRKLYEVGWEQTTKDEDEMEYNQRVVLALELLLGLQTAFAGNYRLNPWSCSPEVATLLYIIIVFHPSVHTISNDHHL